MAVVSRASAQHERFRRPVLALTTVATMVACAEIGTGPEQAAAIEMTPFPSPSVVVGDTLRDANGVVAPVVAVVRNTAGDVISDAPIRYLYADFNRDSALLVDSITGIVVATRAITGDARIAARVGGSLQIIRPLVVTVRPDTLEVSTPIVTQLTTTLPDTGRQAASLNTSQPLTATLRNRDGSAPVPVNGWVVRYVLRSPSNASNDTTAAAFLVDDQGRASVIDTTDASGSAGRRVRVRATVFPTGAADTIEVDVEASYRGQLVSGAPRRLRVPVIRASGTP